MSNDIKAKIVKKVASKGLVRLVTESGVVVNIEDPNFLHNIGDRSYAKQYRLCYFCAGDRSFSGYVHDNSTYEICSVSDFPSKFQTLLESREKEEVKITVQKTDKSEISFDEFRTILNTPIKYFKGDSKIVNKEERLIEIAFLEPNQFDEVFTVEQDVPESPLLRKYFQVLAELINEEISKSDGLDNLDQLEEKAYKEAGYVGKDFNTVKSEALDYGNYKRYLLMKGDNITLTEQDIKFYNRLIENIKENDDTVFSKTKKNSINFAIGRDLKSDYFSFKDKIPCYLNGEIVVLFTKLKDDLVKFDGKENDMNLKVGMIASIMEDDYPEPYFQIVAVDQDSQYYIFDIKPATVKKWKKEFMSYVPILDKIIETGTKSVPYYLVNNKISI